MNPLAGPRYLIEALLLLLQRPALWPALFLPALSALLLSGLGILLAALYGDTVTAALFPSLMEGEWGWLASFALSGGMALAILFFSPWLVLLIGFPLCEPLIAQVDRALGGSETSVGFLEGLLRGLRVSVAVTLIGVGGALALALLGLIPPFSLFILPLQLLVWTPSFAAFDACDGLFGRRQLSLGARLKALSAAPLSTISVGLIVMLLIGIPLLNMLGLPLAAIIGTLYARSRVAPQ